MTQGIEARPAAGRRGAPALATWLCALVCAATVALSALRLRYGVGLGDEATYVAVAYRFALGDVPFVDEHYPAQTGSLFTAPLVKLFDVANGGQAGIVLFTRILYLAFQCGLALVVALQLRSWIGSRLACVVALICVALCPFGIPNLSYNTLSSGFFTLGVFLGLRTLAPRGEAGDRRWLLLAGAAHGFASVALPSYAVVNLAYAGAIAAHLPRGERLRGVLYYAAGGAVAIAAFLPAFLGLDAATLENAWLHLRTAGGWTAKLRTLASQAWFYVPAKAWLAALLATVWLAHRARRGWIVAFGLAALAIFPLFLRRSTSSLWYVAMVAGYGTFFLLLLRRTPLARRLFWCAWAPSMLAALVVTLTSANGIVNSAFGLMPVALCGTAFAVLLHREATAASASRVLKRLDFAFPVLVVVALLGYQRSPFEEDPVEELDTRVAYGPFDGLFTTAEKESYLRSITDDLAAMEAPGRRLLVVYHFPAGYLLTRMRPAASSVWSIACTERMPGECLEGMARDLERWHGPDLVVVRMRAFPTDRAHLFEYPSNELDLILARRFQSVVDRGSYAIFVAKDG